jgi:hypothetical protein
MALPLVADTGGLLRALARRADDRPTGPACVGERFTKPLEIVP